MKRTKVFISYSPKDRRWLERLQVHLRPLERGGRVQVWDNTRTQAGDVQSARLQEALNTAQFAVLLVSADFLASDLIASEELPRLLQAAQEDGLQILLILVGPCLFDEIPSLAGFQPVNPPGKPLIGMTEEAQEDLLVQVSRSILKKMPASVVHGADRPPGAVPPPWHLVALGAAGALALVGLLFAGRSVVQRQSPAQVTPASPDLAQRPVVKEVPKQAASSGPDAAAAAVKERPARPRRSSGTATPPPSITVYHSGSGPSAVAPGGTIVQTVQQSFGAPPPAAPDGAAGDR